MQDIHQSINYAKYLKSLGWKVERISGINYFIRKLPPLGSLLKVQRPQEVRIDTIRNLAKKYHSFQVVIEPKTDLDAKFLESIGYKLSKSPYLPSKTLQIDLTQPQEKIFDNFKKDTRRILKRNRGLRVMNCELKNIEKFRNAWKKAVGLKRHVPPLSHLIALTNSFKKDCLLYHCTSTVIQSGAIFLKAGNIAYYWQAFTNKEGRKLQLQYKIVWEGILWAKSLGCKVFDFEGIYDPRFPNQSWLGFTHFKKSFGGYQVSYPGCYNKLRFPFS